MSSHWRDRKFLPLISITSELSFKPHLEAKYSVTPMFLFAKSFLSIGQFIIPKTSFLRASKCAFLRELITY